MILTDERRYKFLCPLLLQWTFFILVMISPCVSSPNGRDPHTHLEEKVAISASVIAAAIPRIYHKSNWKAKRVKRANPKNIAIVSDFTTPYCRGAKGVGGRTTGVLSFVLEWRRVKFPAINFGTKITGYIRCILSILLLFRLSCNTEVLLTGVLISP